MYKAYEYFWMRNASLPMNTLFQFLDNKELSNSYLNQFKNNLYSVNPEFYTFLKKRGVNINFIEDKQTLRTIYKYLVRNTFRCTPIGSMSILSLGNFENNHERNNYSSFKVYWNLSLEWIFAFLLQNEQNLKVLQKLKIKSNPSLYFRKNKIVLPVHIERTKSKDIVKWKSSSRIEFAESKLLKIILNLTLKEIPFINLVNSIQELYPDVPEDIINNYLLKLIDNQILLTELSDDLYECNLSKLNSAKTKNLSLASILTNIENLSTDTINIKTLEDITQKCNNLIHVDEPVYPILKGTYKHLPINIQEEATDFINYLSNIYLTLNESPEIKQLKQNFIEEYGYYAEVNILALSDPLIGVVNNFKDYTQENSLQEKFKNILQDKLISSIKSNQTSIDIQDILKDYETEEFSLNHSASLALSFMLGDNNKLIISPIVGSQTGFNSFNRFQKCFVEEENIIKKFYDTEISLTHDNYIIADLNEMISTDSVLNVVSTNKNYKNSLNIGVYNIGEFDYSDLYIGYNEQVDRLYIKSKKYNKIVKIVNDSMVNNMVYSSLSKLLLNISYSYETHALEIINFITELSLSYKPKITYKNIVITPETWLLYSYTLKLDSFDTFVQDFKNYKKLKKLSRFFFICEGDRRLLIDSSSDISLDVFYNHIQKSKNYPVKLESAEDHFSYESILKKENYLTEIFVPFYYDNYPSNKLFKTVKKNMLDIPELYIRKTNLKEWIYLNIYASKNIIKDYILTNIQDFINTHNIEQFFYIYYHDEKGPHLRLRFKKNIKDYITYIYELISDLEKNGITFNYNISEYKREVERYGGPELIFLAEDLFSKDSLVTMNTLIQEQNFDEIKFIIAYDYLNYLLNDDIFEKIMHKLFTPYEFKNTYKTNKQKYIDIMSNFPKYIQSNMLNLLHSRKDAALQYASKLSWCKENDNLLNDEADIIRSLFHMMCNRLLLDRSEENLLISMVCLLRHDNIMKKKYTKKGYFEAYDTIF